MPAGDILHEADALAFDGVGENDHGLAHDRAGLREGLDQLVHVVAVNVQNLPAKGGVFLIQRLDFHHVLHPAVNLQTIGVDDGDDVIQMEMSGFHGGFPNLALLLFAVAHQAEDFVLLLVESCG